jgi:hypothetical protein
MPDGTTIVFTGQTSQEATQQLYTADTEGTGLRQLTTTGASQAGPCPNGQLLYVHNGDIYLMSADFRSSKRLTFRGSSLPDCSRDSRTMVFLRNDTLYTLNTTGQHLRRLGPAGSAAGGEAGAVAGRGRRRLRRHAAVHYEVLPAADQPGPLQLRPLLPAADAEPDRQAGAQLPDRLQRLRRGR